MSTTLAEVQERTGRVLTSATPQEVLVEEHTRRVATTKKRIKEALENAGHTTDDDVRIVNGKYVGLFVLPSPNHLYVGFGSMGGQQAYRGEESAFDPKAVANLLVEHAQRAN